MHENQYEYSTFCFEPTLVDGHTDPCTFQKKDLLVSKEKTVHRSKTGNMAANGDMSAVALLCQRWHNDAAAAVNI